MYGSIYLILLDSGRIINNKIQMLINSPNIKG